LTLARIAIAPIGKRSGHIQHVVVADHKGWIDLWNAVANVAGRGSAENAQ
jgi:hypothetical protein